MATSEEGNGTTEETEGLKPFDASDARSVKKRNSKLKFNQLRTDAALKSLLDSGDGRLFIWEILTFCKVFNLTFTGNSNTTAFNEGQRNVGLKLMNDIVRVAPEAVALLLTENNQNNGDSDG